jgi:transcriptional regulator with XRE-family HTH domain
VTTTLTKLGKGRYRHERLGVEIEKTSMPDHPWELAGPDPQGSGVVLARTLGDARAFLQEVESRIESQAERRPISLELLALGHAVRYEREQRDVSSTALAVEAGVETTRVEALENGRLDPDYEMLVRLTRALGVRPSDLIRRAGRLAVGDRDQEPERPSGQDAEASLLALHHHLFPERYDDVSTYEWHAGTIEEVAAILERALTGNPDARLAAG